MEDQFRKPKDGKAGPFFKQFFGPIAIKEKPIGLEAIELEIGKREKAASPLYFTNQPPFLLKKERNNSYPLTWVPLHLKLSFTFELISALHFKRKRKRKNMILAVKEARKQTERGTDF